MSFEIQSVQGTVAELDSDLAAPAQHEREEAVIPVVKKAITDVVESLGGYLSVSCNGNINPVSGENGDEIHIYITSLSSPSIPASAVPAETPAVISPVEETPPVTEPVAAPVETAPVQQETAPVETGEPVHVTEETSQPQPVVPPENTEINTQPSAPITQENSSESPSAISSEPEMNA